MAIGKIPDSFFQQWISPNTGASRPDVLVGPRSGIDAAVIEVAPQRFLAVAEDPIFVVPGVSMDDFGWYTVHIGASDVAVTGVRPTHMTYSLLLPPDANESLIADIVTSISRAARELGIAIVGGHTGYAPVVLAPVIGGITVFGVSDRFISASDARTGDDLIMTKGAAIEAAGILARQYRSELLESGVKKELVERAAGLIRSMSVVRDAEVAFSVRGVHAMHDATEGGVIRGVCEMAASASVGVRLRRSDIFVPDEIAAICRFTGIDPLHAISEGTLLAAVAPDATSEVLHALAQARIEARAIGQFVPADDEIRFDDGQPLAPAAEDPFWKPFFAKLGGGR